VFALGLAALAFAGCPHDPALGRVTFARGRALHVVSFSDCRDRVVGEPKRVVKPTTLRSKRGHIASIRVLKRKAGIGGQMIVIDNRPVYRMKEDYRSVPGGVPGPLGLVAWSPDSRWLFFNVDPMSSRRWRRMDWSCALCVSATVTSSW
jgi:hypothetical protein